jgi:hypothetical protein
MNLTLDQSAPVDDLAYRVPTPKECLALAAGALRSAEGRLADEMEAMGPRLGAVAPPRQLDDRPRADRPEPMTQLEAHIARVFEGGDRPDQPGLMASLPDEARVTPTRDA